MNRLLNKFMVNYKNISKYYKFLINKVKAHENVEIINEWLIDNFYLVVEDKNSIMNNSTKLSKKLKKSQYIYKALSTIVSKNDYNINYKLFLKEMNLYQKQHNYYFSYQELSLVKPLLIIIYYNKLAEVCNNNYLNFIQKDFVKKSISKLAEKDEINIGEFIKSNFDIKNNYYYIFELNNQLNEIGSKTNSFFKDLNEFLGKQNISLKTILNEVYQKRIDDTMLISNIFNNLKEINLYIQEDIYMHLSKCEKILLQDKIYSKMTADTKDLYRNKIIKLAKKYKCSESEYVENLNNKSNEHIGYALFPQKPKKIRMLLYVLTIVILSILFSYVLSNFFISNRIIGFILLLIPTSQLVIQIINQIILLFVKPTKLPKMNFIKGLPKEASTMIVIPTIITDVEKISAMFEKLETFYLINKSNNLYFTLLGDVSSSNQQEEGFDKIISSYGIECAQKLNDKYKKELFHFVYRKRVWNDSENCYLGYERKRGALLHFNRILLHKFSKRDCKKYFFANTLENFDVDIKYVVTLDTDTEPVLNSILNLVGCMDHPLNQPILNKNKTKVETGYALMQPRLNIDIEATNKSMYSQIFAGIGGFDTYSSVIPNVFQDLFLEGSFVGKGIYNLAVFDQLLYQRFPDYLILSHDLLEGNYLRCAYVSDVEFTESFPSKFLVDTSRQHRWARGDVQIFSYLFPVVKNYKKQYEQNPIHILGKWKIFDNIARMFLYPCLLIIILLAYIFSDYTLLFTLYLLLIIAFPILAFLKNKLYFKNGQNKTVYYKNLIFGGKALFIRTYIVLATIPYYTKLYLDAFVRSIYRLFISHKNLLNWITAEEVEKNSKFSLKSYLINFRISSICSIVFILIGVLFQNLIIICMGLIFLSAPFVTYFTSKDFNNEIKLGEKEDDEIITIAKKTWNYFEKNLIAEYHYLIPDNYQENREEKIDERTSPTNIGFSIVSVISAYHLKFISKNTALTYLKNIITTVDSLEKWNGHLYNWYDIKTKEVLPSKFVSTIDSGNLIASMMIATEFLKNENQDDLVKVCEKIIKNANFKKLYTKNEVLSIGYDVLENHLSTYQYNKFASESRLTSFVAIAKGDIPSKHWFCLDKSLTTYKGHKGLISWSGTSFEYYMPFLFMKNYPNTLLDESYEFAYICQKSYMESINRNLPFGISESAYSELDNALNYKYHSFSVPYLKSKEEMSERIVISPYSTLMALELYPREIYENIKKFEKLNMLFKYGFYEAYDTSNSEIVKACFAHHQGMSLMGITNYLKNDILKNYFHQNIKVKTFEILLKEKVQVKANIDLKISKYKKYNYEKEKIENDIRTFTYISDMPEVSVLSNKKYCLLMNDRGDSFSRYRTLQLNRYRKITEQDYGIFFYIQDLDTKKVWSNTYAPINQKPDQYEVVFSSDRIKYLRKDGFITTKTEIIVTANHNAEIRKITFINDSDNSKKLELTSYTEPILSENPDDISHRVFNSMFLESSFETETNSLIMKRVSRTGGATSYMLNRFIIENPLENYSYETDRFSFVERGNSYQNPKALFKKLTNHIGCNIEPIMSLRNTIELLPNDKVSVYFVCGFGRSIEQLKDIINSYNTPYQLEKAFHVASVTNIINTKVLNITGHDMRLYNTMLNYLYQTTKIAVNDTRKDLLRKNALAQNSLWKFGVSGDRPIILVNLKNISNLAFVKEILKAFEYFKNKSIFVDIIILNSENDISAKLIKQQIDDELYRMYTLNSFYHTPGSVVVIDIKTVTREELSLLKIVPRLLFEVTSNESLEEEIQKLQNQNKINDYLLQQMQNNLKLATKPKVEFDNSFGGFQKKGKEYVIYNKNTPTPWSNVIANKNFGTIITNNGCGYTYAYNSGEYKITSWTNEMILNDKSEGIRINNEIFDPEICTHGFGYSILKSETFKFKTEVTEFVAVNENVKIYLVNLTNKSQENQEVDLSYYINPTLGNFEEKTSRHILTEWMKSENYLKLRNVYSIYFSDVNVFMSSSESIVSATENRILIKDITTHFKLQPGEEKMISFMLGCNHDEEKNLQLIKKYSQINNCLAELKNVKKYWENSLQTIQIKTPDSSFDYMLNGWYLYQTLSSRVMARAGFYQVSGAFGYRDQLQDAMNLCLVNKDATKKQILINAAHQFIKGDVLHWWHENNHFGLRSKYKDDYLWLVYATIHYLKITGDYAILDEIVPFIEGDELTQHENERGINFSYSKQQDTLLNHCLLAIDYSINQIGSHHLPLMGGGDWNDGMNMVGIKGKGESIWLGFFLYDIISEFIPLIEKHYENININFNHYYQFNENLKNNLNTYGYDKDYYLRAYFDNGDKLGSYKNQECKIDLISQSFAILSNVAPKEKIESLIEQVEKNLVDKENNLIKLLTPAFSKSLNNPGYIKNYPVGIRENGGQYTHATAWYIMALIKEKYYDLAYTYYQMINPINRSLTEKDILRYKVEPYVIAADIYSNESFLGRGGWTWYTGSAAWYYRVGIEEIIGIKKQGDILNIEPNIPSNWNSFEINYKYQKANYHIIVQVGNKNELTINGKKETKIKLETQGNFEILIIMKRG